MNKKISLFIYNNHNEIVIIISSEIHQFIKSANETKSLYVYIEILLAIRGVIMSQMHPVWVPEGFVPVGIAVDGQRTLVVVVYTRLHLSGISGMSGDLNCQNLLCTLLLKKKQF